MSTAKSVTATFQRNNVGVQVGKPPGIPPSSSTLQATLTARVGCGPISYIAFGTAGHQFDNARITIIAPGGPTNQTAGFTYTPPGGTTAVTLTIQRVVPSGGATVNPIHFVDGCGDWITFVGGGPGRFSIDRVLLVRLHITGLLRGPGCLLPVEASSHDDADPLADTGPRSRDFGAAGG